MKIKISALIISFVIILCSYLDGQGEKAFEEGICCPQSGSLCIVGSVITENAYAVNEARQCPSYPFVFFISDETEPWVD